MPELEDDAESIKAAIDRLEAEKRGRQLGVTGEAAAALGEWMSWVFEPEMEQMRAPRAYQPEEPSTGFTSGRRERPARTTTAYSKPKTPEEPKDWHPIWVTVRDPSDNHPGTIEEAQYGVVGGEVWLADLDGAVFAKRQLEDGEDPALAARRLLRGRSPRRSNVIAFPKIGVA